MAGVTDKDDDDALAYARGVHAMNIRGDDAQVGRTDTKSRGRCATTCSCRFIELGIEREAAPLKDADGTTPARQDWQSHPRPLPTGSLSFSRRQPSRAGR